MFISSVQNCSLSVLRIPKWLIGDLRILRLIEIENEQNFQLSVQYERLAHESLQMQVECRNRAQKAEDLEQAKNAKQSLIAHLSALNKQLRDANERAKVQQQLVTKVMIFSLLFEFFLIRLSFIFFFLRKK